MKSSMKKMTAALAAALVAGLAVADPPASATFGVSAAVAPQCVVGNTTNMGFGSLAMLDSSTGGLTTQESTAHATFSAACTNSTPAPRLSFASANGGGTGFAMTGGSLNQSMNYKLYFGADTTGDLIAHNSATLFAAFVADGTVKSLEVTGLLTPGDKQGMAIGDYADTVTITASFGVAP